MLSTFATFQPGPIILQMPPNPLFTQIKAIRDSFAANTQDIATFYLWKYSEFHNSIFGKGESKYNSQNLITDLVS